MNGCYNTTEAFETVPSNLNVDSAPAVHALAVLNASTREPFSLEVCMESKTCTRCGEDRSLRRFRPEHNVCRDCRNARQREWRRENLDRLARYRATFRRKHPDRILKYRKARHAKNPALKRVMKTVYRALKRGHILRPERCECCGNVESIVGHHDDYNAALAVRWLCHRCHDSWHKENEAVMSKEEKRDE